ncbi:MAG: M23 family metallopeptidase, partial [Acidimicrobiaceae bacterium]|nr:M23 family metallopeptidase [Acidimicrobiaceae bacterium]
LGWETMQPTLAAHAVQRNADPNYYTAYWPKAMVLLAALAGSSAVDAIAASSAGSASPIGCVTPVAYASGVVGWPVPAQWVRSDAHNYGQTGSHWASFHTGTDFEVPLGTPVLAATSGVVHLESGGGWSWAGRWLVQVQTAGPGSLTTWYAHMEQLSVTEGQYVTVGQQLGLSGAEGNVTGPHLHFEVHPHGGGYMADQVDPSTWLAQHVGKPVDSTGSGVAGTTPQTIGSTS